MGRECRKFRTKNKTKTVRCLTSIVMAETLPYSEFTLPYLLHESCPGPKSSQDREVVVVSQGEMSLQRTNVSPPLS